MPIDWKNRSLNLLGYPSQTSSYSEEKEIAFLRDSLSSTAELNNGTQRQSGAESLLLLNSLSPAVRDSLSTLRDYLVARNPTIFNTNTNTINSTGDVQVKKFFLHYHMDTPEIVGICNIPNSNTNNTDYYYDYDFIRLYEVYGSDANVQENAYTQHVLVQELERKIAIYRFPNVDTGTYTQKDIGIRIISAG